MTPQARAFTLPLALAIGLVAIAACSHEDLSLGDGQLQIAATSGSGGQVGAAGEPGVDSGTIELGGASGAAGAPDVMNGQCNQYTFQSSRTPADVLLLLDRSGSMVLHEIAPGVTRWDGVVPIVNDAVTATDEAVSWGLKVFPEGTGNNCEPSSVTDFIDVEIAALNAANVVSNINMQTPAGDGTPTAAAVAESAAYLSGIQNDHQKFILLATDGEPTCALALDGVQDSPDAQPDAVAAIGDALAANIPVYVVGVLDDPPDQDTIDQLNAMAIAGGKPRSPNPIANKFYLASTEAELTAALSDISGEVTSCIFPFEKAPPDPTNIAVKINGQKSVRDTTHSSGWDYTSSDDLGVEIFGALCQQIKDANTNQIDIIFGCPGVPIK